MIRALLFDSRIARACSSGTGALTSMNSEAICMPPVLCPLDPAACQQLKGVSPHHHVPASAAGVPCPCQASYEENRPASHVLPIIARTRPAKSAKNVPGLAEMPDIMFHQPLQEPA